MTRPALNVLASPPSPRQLHNRLSFLKVTWGSDANQSVQFLHHAEREGGQETFIKILGGGFDLGYPRYPGLAVAWLL